MSYTSIYIKGNIRAYLSDLTDVAQVAIIKQKTTPLASLALATSVAVFGPFAIIKTHGRTSSMIKSNGSIKNIIVESNSSGDIRALVGNNEIITEWDDLGEEKINAIPLPLAIGDSGTLKIIHEYDNENFGGEVMLAKSDIVTDLAYYFDQSEQIYTAVVSDVHLESKTKLKRASSAIFQMLPGFTEEDTSWLESFIKETKLSKNTIEEYAKKFGGNYLASKELQWKCTCSPEKMKELVNLLDVEEQKAIIAEQGFIEVTCNFCNEKYKIY